MFGKKNEQGISKTMLVATNILSNNSSKQLEHEKYENRIQNIDVFDFLKSIKTNNFFDLVIIDPPYNIGKNFGNNSDSKPLEEYIFWTKQYLNECMRLVKPNVPIYLYGLPEILCHIAVNYPLNNQRWLAWHYTNKTVPASKFWQRSYESIFCLWKGNRPKLNVDKIRESYTETFLKNSVGKVRKSKHCRYSKGNSTTLYKAHSEGALPRDVIKISALAGGSGSRERMAYCRYCEKLVVGKDRHNHDLKNLISHPTQKPIKLTERLIKGSNPKNILIPFAGSGSECYVARKLNVNFYAAELNEDYVKLANKWLETIASID